MADNLLQDDDKDKEPNHHEPENHLVSAMLSVVLFYIHFLRP